MRQAVLLFVVILGLTSNDLFSQQKLDQSFQFPSGGTFRKYHIYIPSSYNQGTANKLMLGLHPFNTSRWDGKSWRDSLTTFAEHNDLLLICPDGGIDGRIDDQVDYDFTSVLLDSMKIWYNVDASQVFAVGFSVGGLASYEYALNNAQDFKGVMPMGAAISDPSFVDDVIVNAKCKNFYLIHGGQDNPNTRYYPMKTRLESNGANVDAILLAGIGHTFDFPNRFQIMNMGFNYIDTASCDYTGVSTGQSFEPLKILPNPVLKGEIITISWPGNGDKSLTMHDANGRLIVKELMLNAQGKTQIYTGEYKSGIYILSSSDVHNKMSRKIVITN